MKSRMYKIICFLIVLPCILLNQHFASAYNIKIDGCLDEYDTSIFKSYRDIGNNISYLSMAKLVDKDNKKLYLAFNVKEETVTFNKNTSSLKININNDDYKFTAFCNNAVKSESNDIMVTTKSLIKDDAAYSTELCVEFKGKMPDINDLTIQGIDSKGISSNILNMEEPTSKVPDTSTTKSNQIPDNTASVSTSKSSSKSTTAAAEKVTAATAVKSTAGNSGTVKATNSSTPKSASANSSDYTLGQNNADQNVQDAVQMSSDSQGTKTNQSGSNIKKIIGIIIAAILIAAAAVLPILEHKKSKKKSEKDEVDDLTNEDSED